jgi:hypothetical protein
MVLGLIGVFSFGWFAYPYLWMQWGQQRRLLRDSGFLLQKMRRSITDKINNVLEYVPKSKAKRTLNIVSIPC